MELQFTQADDLSPAYTYEKVSENFLTSSPTQMDAYDRKYAYIGDSTVVEVSGKPEKIHLEPRVVFNKNN